MPKKQTERIKEINKIKNHDFTSIIYESPHRFLKTLEDLYKTIGDRQLCIGREITKEHEEFLYFTLNEAINYYKNIKPLGEFTIIIEGLKKIINSHEKIVYDMLTKLKSIGINKKNSVKIISKLLNINKNMVYKLSLKKD